MQYNYSKGVLEYALNNGITKDQLNKNFSEINIIKKDIEKWINYYSYKF